MSTVPIGRQENEHLEFKAAAVVKDLPSVGRAVGAMLNAAGGEVWIGIAERQGVADRVDPVEDAEGARRRILDHLVETIEPSPKTEEVKVEVVPAEAGAVLRIQVQPQKDRRPYAHLKGGARRYEIRFGDRVRPMTREEILDRNEPTADGGASILLRKRAEFRTPLPTLWLRIQPDPSLSLDLQDSDLADLLRNPSRSANRPDGWVCTNPYVDTHLDGGSLWLGERSYTKNKTLTEIHADGAVVFTVPLANMRCGWEYGTPGGDANRELHPYAVVEYPVSVFRLAKELYLNRLPANSRVFADMALLRPGGWKLRRHSPDSIGYALRDPEVAAEGEDILKPEPFSFAKEELIENPDGCAYKLVRWVYQAFGHPEDHIPREFDPQTRRLVFAR